MSETDDFRMMRMAAERWAAYELVDRSRVAPPLPREARERGTILRDGASEDQIRAAEERLGVRLPRDYRNFLLLSNGAFGSAALGADSAYHRRHGYLPVEEIGPVTELDPSWCKAWLADVPIAAEAGRPAPALDDCVAHVQSFRPKSLQRAHEAIVISQPCDANATMLVPGRGQDGWQVWEAAFEGQQCYTRFAVAVGQRLRRRWYGVPRREILPELIEDLTQRTDKQRRAATLGWMAALDAGRLITLAPLIEAVPGTSAGGRRQLAEVLGRLHAAGEPGALGFLEELASRPNDLDQVIGLFGLVEADQPGVGDRLIELAGTTSDEIASAWCWQALDRLAAR